LSNPYYGPSGSPVNQSRGSSAQVRAEFGLVEAGFTAVNTAILGIQSSTISAILPSQAGNAGRVLSTNGTTISWIDNAPAVAAYATNSGQLGGVAANGYALLSGATFTGATNVLNVAAGNNTTLAANTAFVTAAVAQAKADIVGSSPAALDTLNEFAIALGNDANFATTTATALGNRLRVDTAAQGLNSTQRANAVTNLGLATVATSGLKADVGLGNVDNTSDANKPASTAQAAINAARVTGVTATAPVVSSGGMAPVISMPAATTGTNGYLTAADWNTFNAVPTALALKANLSGGAAFTGVVSSAGNLLIGTTTDDGTNKLQVAGKVAITGPAVSGAAGSWRNGSDGSRGTGYMYSDGGGAGVSDLSLGFGNGVYWNTTSGYVCFQTGGVERIVANAAGRILIGTLSDDGANKLQVNGSISATSYTGSGANLTSLTSAQINTALGFTPYNSTNPSGYISSITSGNVTTALGFTPANSAGQAFTGNISAPIFTATSDERKKTNWRPLTDAQLDALANMQLAGLFDWKDGSGASLGGSAQEIARIVPEAVHEDEEGNLTVNYGGLCFAIQQATLRRLWGAK
jgi:hypothetical protein